MRSRSRRARPISVTRESTASSASERRSSTLCGKLQQAAAVGGDLVAGEQLRFLARAQAGGLDFAHLVAQQIELALQRRLVGGEAGALLLERGEPAKELLVFLAQRLGAGKGIEQRELLLRGEERLVIVRAVEIDEVLAEALEHAERGGAAIDELPVRARGGEDALDQELPVFARLDPLLRQLAHRAPRRRALQRSPPPCSSPRRCG